MENSTNADLTVSSLRSSTQAVADAQPNSPSLKFTGVLAALAAAAILMTTGEASATIIDNGWYTTDTSTGLEWADLTLTDGRSYQSILTGAGHSVHAASGWLNEGWRHANHAEVLGFWEEIGGIEILASGPVAVTLQTMVQSYVGRTHWSGGFSSRAWSFGMIAEDYNAYNTHYMGVYRVHSNSGSFHSVYGVDLTQNASMTGTWGHGHWLVRGTATTVPEPGTLWLVLSGMIALRMHRRRCA